MNNAILNDVVSSGKLVSRRNLFRGAGGAVLAILTRVAWNGIKEKQQLSAECDAIIPAIWSSIPQDLDDKERALQLQEKFKLQWGKEKPAIRWTVDGENVMGAKKNKTSAFPDQYDLVRWYKIQSDNTLKGVG